jgi:hypothetical protein
MKVEMMVEMMVELTGLMKVEMMVRMKAAKLVVMMGLWGLLMVDD